MGIVVGEYDDAATCRRYGKVIHGGNAHLPAIRQMNGERHKWHRVN